MEFIGALLDAKTDSVQLLLYKLSTIVNLITQVQIMPRIVRSCLQVLDQMGLGKFVTSHVRLDFRDIHTWFKTIYVPSKPSLNMMVTVPQDICQLLDWWKDLNRIYIGMSFISSILMKL